MIEPYADIEFADEFFALYLGNEGRDDWSEFCDIQKTALLVRATLAIDLLDNIKRGFRGERTRSAQPNAFPRNGDTFVPEKVRMACALEALALADEEGAQRRGLRRQGVSGMSVGNVSENYMRFGLFDNNTRNRAHTNFSESLASHEAFGLMLEFLDVSGVHRIL